MLKSLQVKVGDLVTHLGKKKTIVATSLSRVMLSDFTIDELANPNFNWDLFAYGDWIDLDEIEIEGGWK